MAFLEVYWSMIKSRMNCALTDQFIGMKVNIIYWSVMSREFVQNSSGICIPDINKPKRINTVKSNKYSNVLFHTGKVPQLLAYLTSHKDIWSLKKPRICRTQKFMLHVLKNYFQFKNEYVHCNTYQLIQMISLVHQGTKNTWSNSKT